MKLRPSYLQDINSLLSLVFKRKYGAALVESETLKFDIKQVGKGPISTVKRKRS